MRRGFGLVGLLLTAILLVIVGSIAYNIGWSDGAAQHLPAVTNGDGAPYYYYGPHYFGGGFALFGIFWFLLIVFGLFWLFRFAFFARRMGGGGWGYGRKWGYGPGMPPSFEERAQEWHRRQHGEQPSATTPPPPPPPADTRNV